MQDTSGRSWVCREEEPSSNISIREWAWWAHYAGVAASFAQCIGEVISEKDPFEDVRRVMDGTVTLAAADESALPDALAKCKG